MTRYGEVQDWMKKYVESVTEASGCTAWPFSTFKRSGRACAYNSRRRSIEMAGRTTWEMLYGRSFPEGSQARHLCGNGHLGCANPFHIIPGTHAENVADRARDGRELVGERNPKAVLTDATVLQICTRVAAGERAAAVARDLGLTRSLVSQVWTGKTWTHVDAPRKAG